MNDVPNYLIVFFISSAIPFWLLLMLWGITCIKRLLSTDWKVRRESADSVARYEELTSEERMKIDMSRSVVEDIKKRQEKDRKKNLSYWLGSPDAKEENKEMNERAFKEGLAKQPKEVDKHEEEHN